MDETHSRLLDEVRGLVAARALIDLALDERITDCVDSDVDRTTLAYLLGIDRSTLYRRHLRVVRGGAPSHVDGAKPA